MHIPLQGTTAEALAELLGTRRAAAIQALRVWHKFVVAGQPDAEFEYLALEDGQHLRVIRPDGLVWEVVRFPSHLAFYCVAGPDYGEPVIPIGTIASAKAERELEMASPDVHIVHDDDHLRRRPGEAVESAKITAYIASL